MRRNNSLGRAQLRSRDIFWAIGTLVLAFQLFYLHFWEFFGFILFFHQHLKERFKTRRNVAYRVKTVVKLGFFKFIILPIVSYDLTCVHRTRGSFRDIEAFQKKSLKWVCGTPDKDLMYNEQLWPLIILRLPLFLQLNDMFSLSSTKKRNITTLSFQFL